MDIFTMLVIGQVLGAIFVLAGGYAALVVAGRLKSLFGEAEEADKANGGEDAESGMVESGLPGFQIHVGRANSSGLFEMRIMGRTDDAAEPVTVMTIEGVLSMGNGFYVRLPGADWVPVEDPISWAIQYCAGHRSELFAAVEALK